MIKHNTITVYFTSEKHLNLLFEQKSTGYRVKIDIFEI